MKGCKMMQPNTRLHLFVPIQSSFLEPLVFQTAIILTKCLPFPSQPLMIILPSTFQMTQLSEPIYFSLNGCKNRVSTVCVKSQN